MADDDAAAVVVAGSHCPAATVAVSVADASVIGTLWQANNI